MAKIQLPVKEALESGVAALALVVAAVLVLAGCGGGNDSESAAESEIRQVVNEFSTSSDPAVCDLGTQTFHVKVWGGSGTTAIEACRTQLPRLKRSGQVSIRNLGVSGSSASAEVTFGDGERGEYRLIDTEEGWRLHGYVLTKEGSNTGETQQQTEAPAQTKEGSNTGKTQEQTEAPTQTVDVGSIEASLESSLGGSGSTTSSAPKVTAVDCPASVPAEKGASFDCDASGEQGLKGTVQITLDDARGESFSYKGNLKSAGFTSKVSGELTAE